jgi:hypothetical protein
MLGPRGKTWRVTIIWLLCLVMAPGLSNAGSHFDVLNSCPSWMAPLSTISAESPQSLLEAQLFGEKPYSKNSHLLRAGRAPLSEILPGLGESADEGAALGFPHNLELRISFLYNDDNTVFSQERPIQSHLLFKYSMDYALLPNLRVGLRGFLYHPPEERAFFQRRYGDMVFGFGPGIKYDLGSWSFTFQSLVDTGSRDRRDGFHNWFRVWYAF